jgi:hypothetical protein
MDRRDPTQGGRSWVFALTTTSLLRTLTVT